MGGEEEDVKAICVCLCMRGKNNEPRQLLKHAACAIGDFLIHASGLDRVNFALAEFLFGGVET